MCHHTGCFAVCVSSRIGRSVIGLFSKIVDLNRINKILIIRISQDIMIGIGNRFPCVYDSGLIV